jgi:hypothetical protein
MKILISFLEGSLKTNHYCIRGFQDEGIGSVIVCFGAVQMYTLNTEAAR